MEVSFFTPYHLRILSVRVATNEDAFVARTTAIHAENRTETTGTHNTAAFVMRSQTSG
jgi:hypothetical protein